jgi:radical SAM protein with 4Fe4S-binding SPASM domain
MERFYRGWKLAETRIQHVTADGMRLHLRKGNPGMLWINGQDMLLLNDTAASFIEAYIDVMKHHRDKVDAGEFKKEIVRHVQKSYPRVPEDILIKDFDSIYGTLRDIGNGTCPASESSLETQETDPKLWIAPPRADLALTYRCNNNCYFCYTGGPRQVSELNTRQWKKVIDKLWDSGVPQIVFTGGEPTLRDDLVELVESSQEFVTGLVTNGRKIAPIAGDLYKASLDYVQISWESHIADIHDRMVGVPSASWETEAGIQAALKSGLSVITNTTLTKDNLALFPDQVKAGAAMGLKMMACNTLICSGRGTCSKQENGPSYEELKQVLPKAIEAAEKAGVKLEWYTPTCYKQFNPVEMGLGAKACSAAQYNLTVEPDGAVIPCQSWFKDKLGNMLKDKWADIWNHPVAVGFRNKEYLKGRKECEGCEFLYQCCGGCPLEY